MATIEEFQKIEMKIGKILSAEYVEGADKLLKLSVDFGLIVKPQLEVKGYGESLEDAPASEEEGQPEARDIRQILSGIREYYEPEVLVGMECPFVTNLEPRTIRGYESHGMILAIGVDGGGIALLHPDKDVTPGSSLR